MPALMPIRRTRFSTLPAWPVCSGGAVAMIALVFGEMNRPCPTPKSARASVTSGRFAADPSRKTWIVARLAMQISMPQKVGARAPKRS